MWKNRHNSEIVRCVPVIDANGYRANVGIIVSNAEGRLLWARRCGQEAWQFPQGGIKRHESPEQALFRELWEEVGLTEQEVVILGQTREWLCYRLPHGLVRHNLKPTCIGQKQIWYLLQLKADSSKVKLDTCCNPEFDRWRWVDYWLPLREVVPFKREVYRLALEEFAPLMQTRGYAESEMESFEEVIELHK